MLTTLFRLGVILSLLTTCAVALADEMSDARAAGIRVLENLEQRKNVAVWNSGISEWFKERMTEAAFLANMTTVQAQLGGPASDRKLVQQNRVESNAQIGYEGPIFTFMFATKFPTVKTYETIVIIREGGVYKASGLNWIPNPN